MSIWEKTSRRISWQIVLLSALLLALGWLSVSSLTFFSGDTGLRYYQVRELIDNGWRTVAVDYPARFLDPHLEHVPFYYAYVVVDDQLFLSISPYFPLLASFLTTLLGTVGLAVLPVLGTVATAAATYRLAKLSGLSSSPLVLWATALATPLLFYALAFWDHAFVTAFALWGVAFLAGGVAKDDVRSLLAGSILLALAWVQRPEFAVLVAAVGVSLLLTRFHRSTALAFGMGNLIGALPLFLLQHVWYGHPLGIVYARKLFRYGEPASYAIQPYSGGPPLTQTDVMSRLLTYVASGDPLTFAATLLGLLGLLLIVFSLRVPGWRTRRLLLSGLLLSLGSYALWLIPMWQGPVTGILPTLPLLPLSLAIVDTGGEEREGETVYRFLLVATFLFLGLMLLIWPAFGGKQWGARYLLPAYPLLLYLAFYSFEHYRERLQPPMRSLLGLTFVGLLAASVLVQAAGVRVLFDVRRGQEATRQALRDLPATLILTNSSFGPAHLTSLEDKMFLYVRDEEDISALVPRMVEHGVRRFALAPVEGLSLTVPERVGNIVLQEGPSFVYELIPMSEGPQREQGGFYEK
jgi:hypothetical protein